ncbi:lysoplasmalogenase family protein [Arthrobacter sp. TWP1-1]|uniref:lysoplasmalogenase family protein n=1 Tax=Arthrobacter sp. TWP1-1 TaxID=2804568 RepID=UPI003CFAF03D
MKSELIIPAKDAWQIAMGFIPYAVVSIVHVGARFADNELLADPTKLFLMPLLIVAVILAARRSLASGMENGGPARGQLAAKGPWFLLLAGLFFSWLGDGAGALFPFAPTLPLMLLFFGIAHLCYMRLFWRHLAVRTVSWWALAFAGWWVVLLIIMWPRAEGLAIAVALYGLVLGGTAALSTRCNVLVLWGGIFFLASDTILSFRIFALELMPDWTSGMVMLTYTIGQGLIAAGALVTLYQANSERKPVPVTAR